MIASGEKTEEYREPKPYWIKRILEDSPAKLPELTPGSRHLLLRTKYERVCFHRGYTSQTMIFEIKDVLYDMGKPAWGAPVSKTVIIIKLGNRIA